MNKLESKYFHTALRMNEALISLLEKKDLEFITVKEICETAGVNRSTFYLHYETISDLMNETVEKDSIHIRMLSPICLYSTNKETKKTYFYSPEEEAFPEQVNDNFVRKYTACYGIPPNSGIEIETVNVRRRDKYVTKYKEFYLSGWLGEYRLTGERKYLDFLYQTGLGSRNAQGFGMFEESPQRE